MPTAKVAPLAVVHPGEGDLNWVQKGGKVALEAGGTNLYFALGAPDDDESGSWLDGATAHPLKLTLLYFDVGTETIQIGYSSDAAAEIGALETVVTKGNTGTWKRATYTLAASMRVGHDVYEDYGYADFRLKSSGLLVLNEVRVRETTLKVKAVWQAAEVYIDESYEGTETDDVASEAITSGKIADNIQSDNYVLGASGWKIWRDTGDAEFNNVTVRGTIYATVGQIGGFDIGADYVRDAANSFGLASTVTGGNDVRFWAGATFANRATAPLQLYEDGYIFAKDIVLAKGSLTNASGATGYGYAVDPSFLCHYDGPRPHETDFTGSAIGHKGQVDTRGGGVSFRTGKFGKAVSIAEGTTTNLVTNPSFETSGTTGWTTFGTWATNAQSTTQSRFGSNSCKLVNSSGAEALKYFVFTAAATTSTISIWVFREAGTATLSLTLKQNFGGFSALATTTVATTLGVWSRVVVTGATSIGSDYRVEVASQSGNTLYIDGAQAESTAYVTPYLDGAFGTGYAWAGTAHASTSTRAAATLTYPASGNLNLAQGSLSFWYYANASLPTNAYAFGARIDANNYLRVNLAVSGANKPIAESASGGSAVSTASGATTASADGWHHVAVTWTVGSLILYLDGAVSGATATYAVPAGTLATIELGAFNGASQADTLLDDVCLLPIVLSDHEVKAIYYSSAPLMLGVSNQELRLSGAGLGDVFGNANGLFGRGADGTPSFGLLNGTVNATVWGGASESFDSGDFLFGSNASGKSNVAWDASAGAMYFRVATTKKVSIDTSGTVLFGSDVSSPSTTRFAFFSGSVTYNSESFAAGDLLLGNNTANKANVKYDESSGRLRFRQGSTTNIYIDTDGSQVFLAEAFPASSYLKWKDSSGNLIGDLAGSYSVGNSASVILRGYGRNAGTTVGVSAIAGYRYGGSNEGTLVVYSDDIGAYYVDSNDQQALLASDSAALDDNGWNTGAVDYGEYIEKADAAEKLERGDIVWVRGKRVTKRAGGGTPMVVSTYAGIRGGNPLHWGNKWLPEAEYVAQYGDVPGTIWAWAKKHSKTIPFVVDPSGERRIRPRYCARQKADGRVVLNPAWDFEKGFTPRDKRTKEWIVIAFSGQVPVKVVGTVNEGDYILPGAAGDGFGLAVPSARVTFDEYRRAVGIAWEAKADPGAGSVLVAVGVK